MYCTSNPYTPYDAGRIPLLHKLQELYIAKSHPMSGQAPYYQAQSYHST